MQLPKVYEPGEYENDIYALWEKSKAFKPKNRGNDDTYSIVLPPPNANANIHIGTSLVIALEDIAIRYNRMLGKATLMLPGADHAGFETQSVYEKHLAKEGKSRFDFSREELYSQIYDFVGKNRQNFETQFRKLGLSCDWDRYTYTLDEHIVERAYETFKKMWDEGLIYRGERLVNYCTNHRTGFADIEVEHEDTTSPLYYIKYGPFELATTRPETKFGDTAVAVHPDDQRYAKYVGKTITVEGVNGSFDVMVIADEMVDPEFGTGVVKITPAHSFDDWEVAQRHNLPAVRVINHDGTMNEKAGRFRGLTVVEARTAVAKAMEESGLLLKVDENYTNRVGKCYKCGTVIEPMLMKQWFIDMQPLAKRAITSLKNNEITFYPESKKEQLITYLQNLRDWNISRQIAWGIPIPAFQNINDEDDWIFNENISEELIEVDGKTYKRDPDVFDTWFSSSSWPYATMKYPDSDDYKNFYPISLMETGGEILYPWVSRMIMLGLYVTDNVPFEDVYIHGYVMAEDGSKMSKSVGNVVDPIPVVEEYGSDALRLGIIAGRSPGVNRGYNTQKVVDGRNFCNKLWNIARYIEAKVGDDFTATTKPQAKSIADHWMLYKIQQSISSVSSLLDSYRFAEAYDTVYHLVWSDLADWYIEASKTELNTEVLSYSLTAILKLTHPFAPFVTETIWQTLGWEDDSLLITSSWPTLDTKVNATAAKEFEIVQSIVNEIRFISSEMDVKKPTLIHVDNEFANHHSGLLVTLGGLGDVELAKSSNGVKITSAPFDCWLDIDANTAKAYTAKLKDKISTTRQSIKQLEGRLNNKNYVDKAPEKLVNETKQQLESAKELLAVQQSELKRFK